MTNWLIQKRLFICCTLLVVAANVFVGLTIWYNRSKADSALWLTERELRPASPMTGDNTGLQLMLRWRVLGDDKASYPASGAPYWLKGEKLATLGFDVEKYLRQYDPKTRRYGSPLPRKVLLVLEADSPHHTRVVRQLAVVLEQARSRYEGNKEDERLKGEFEEALKNLERERYGRSRLFVIDAGLDHGELRSRYPDRSRYLIAPGLVRMARSYERQADEVNGYITRLAVENIQVNLAHRQKLEKLTDIYRWSRYSEERPTFAAKLAYGRKLDPWLVEIGPVKR